MAKAALVTFTVLTLSGSRADRVLVVLDDRDSEAEPGRAGPGLRAQGVHGHRVAQGPARRQGVQGDTEREGTKNRKSQWSVATSVSERNSH